MISLFHYSVLKRHVLLKEWVFLISGGRERGICTRRKIMK